MARKREYVRVRIETLETMIGFNLALRRDDCVNELKRLARHVGAPLDNAVIVAAYERTKKELSR
jgi:hypothetical protein